MSLRLKYLLVLLILISVPAVWLRWQAVDAHDQMIALLEEVKNKTPIDNLYLGDADLKRINQQIVEAQSPVGDFTGL